MPDKPLPNSVQVFSRSQHVRPNQRLSNHFVYNASKGDATHLVRLMSVEFVDRGIRVSGISPGYFPSEMTTKTESDGNQKSHSKDHYMEGKDLPTGYPSDEKDVRSTILYLVSRGGGVMGMLLSLTEDGY
jgi:NAD(P)-dependent dehydrogenase (short-subunit alcohol dehydrogenase family)